MKFRNKFVSKRIGTKTLASLLAFGMALGSPMAVFADDGETGRCGREYSAGKTIVKHISDRIGVMYLGKMVELTESSKLYVEPKHPYRELFYQRFRLRILRHQHKKSVLC